MQAKCTRGDIAAACLAQHHSSGGSAARLASAKARACCHTTVDQAVRAPDLGEACAAVCTTGTAVVLVQTDQLGQWAEGGQLETL